MLARSPKYTTYNQKNKSVKLPSFLSAQNLQPFVNKYLTVPSNRFEYIRKDNTSAIGYLAELLPKDAPPIIAENFLILKVLISAPCTLARD
jgi:hypothetical protein